jgi:hypothetical protein
MKKIFGYIEIRINKMSIKVYWACLEEEWLSAEEPEKVINRLSNFYNPKTKTYATPILGCPAIKTSLNNTYALKSIYDYKIIVDGTQVTAPLKDQAFYDNHIEVRSINDKFFSFQHRFIFFTDSPSLELTLYLHPFLEDNDVSKKCMLIPGVYDIGKWFRSTELPFFIKPSEDTFSIKTGDAYCYIKFDTKEKIVFEQFRWTPTLDEYRLDGFRLNGLNEKIRNLKDYYSMFKHKNLILQEIKKNRVGNFYGTD